MNEARETIEIGLSVREAARRIGCDPSRVRKLIKRGLLRGYRDGRRVRVEESSVRAYQLRSPIASTSPIPEQQARPRPERQRYQEALALLQRHGVR